MQAISTRGALIRDRLDARPPPGPRPSAQTPEQFYKGKSIELVIGYPPAGSNDVYARLVARHHRQAHPRQSDRSCRRTCRAPAASSRSRTCLQRRAEGRHRRSASARRPPPLDEKLGTPGRALQDRRAELDRPRRLAGQHGVPLAHLAGEDLRRRAEDRIQAVRHRRRLHRVDLSAGDEQRARHQVQADHGLQGLRPRRSSRSSAARSRAIRRRGPR